MGYYLVGFAGSRRILDGNGDVCYSEREGATWVHSCVTGKAVYEVAETIGAVFAILTGVK